MEAGLADRSVEQVGEVIFLFCKSRVYKWVVMIVFELENVLFVWLAGQM